MKLLRLAGLLILSSFFSTIHAQKIIPFSDPRWTIEAKGYVQEFYKGHYSLYLQEGKAWLKDERFLNGIIEFDIYQQERTSFSGFFFRMSDSANYEDIYLRPHQSGNPDAYQYTPVFNGDAGWQLYHDPHDADNDGYIHWKQRGKMMGYNTVIEFPFDRWMHVKLLVKDKQAELYIDGKLEPVGFIRELLSEQKAGMIGVDSRVGAAWFANFSFTPTDDIEFKTKNDGYKIITPSGTITSWQVSTAFNENILKNADQLDTKWLNRLSWKSMITESTGLANLSRFFLLDDSANTVLAKLVIRSDKDQLKKLDIGYSDRVRVYSNRQILYSGNTGFRTRDYRYLGTIGYFDAVYLPLKKGENTIILAVSESFGGWGVMGKIENREAMKVE